ncbi:hypothetical protein ACWCSD_13255 [Nonomuraea sp. NPDC001684]
MLAAAGLVAAPAPAAFADSATYLNTFLGAYERWEGDLATGGGKVFVSVKDRIVVTDSRGLSTGTVTGLSGAAGLASTQDGTRLYAALSGSNEVAEIDTSGPTITRRINLASYPCPSKLSLSGDRLWVGYGCAGTWGGGVVSLDVDVTAPEPQPVEVGPRTYAAPLVAAAGDTLVMSGSDDSQDDLTVYDTSTTSATLRGVIDGQTNAGLAAAKARGRTGGRPTVITPELLRGARDMLPNPANSITSIAKLLGVTPGTLSNHIPDLHQLRTG